MSEPIDYENEVGTLEIIIRSGNTLHLSPATRSQADSGISYWMFLCNGPYDDADMEKNAKNILANGHLQMGVPDLTTGIRAAVLLRDISVMSFIPQRLVKGTGDGQNS